MIRKLRTQLLLIFLFFGAINGAIIVTYIFQSNQKEKIEILEDYIHQIQVLIHSDTKEINNFFTYDTKNAEFFSSKESVYLNKHKHQQYIINLLIKRLTSAKEFKKIKCESQVKKLLNDLDTLNNLVTQISEQIYLRGFKDDGIEGKMRQYAHKIENYKEVPQADILMLRRNEKDYIIRNDEQYINQFQEQANLLKQKIQKSNIGIKTKSEILSNLNKYDSTFNQMVTLDKKIGLKDNSETKLKLDKTVQQVLSDAELLKQNSNIYRNKLYKKLKTISFYSLIGIVLISILLSFYFSKIITNRISLLSANTAQFIASCFTIIEPLKVTKRNDEVGKLIVNFEHLKQNIVDQIKYLEVKVNQRTEEINTQKEQILAQNKKMMDSVRYALNIQEAILPDHDYIASNFPEHFVLFRPKDLVSGDFYWFKRITKTKVDYSVFVVADCTGHGVPGAFMSMLGIAFLNEIVVHKNITNAADILDQLRQKIIENLSQQNNTKRINDGIDMALVMVNHHNNKLQFSGAHRDLTLIRNGELKLINGDKMPIGKFIKDEKPFTNHTFDYQKDDILYLFSDGFSDQYGGPNWKKYLRKNLRNFLLENSRNTMAIQKLFLERELNTWMGTHEQTDDICLAGIKL